MFLFFHFLVRVAYTCFASPKSRRVQVYLARCHRSETVLNHVLLLSDLRPKQQLLGHSLIIMNILLNRQIML